MQRVVPCAAWLIVSFAFGCAAGQSQDDLEAARLCRSDYLRARTAADTTIVDARSPVLDREQASTALTCGAMRQVGWTK